MGYKFDQMLRLGDISEICKRHLYYEFTDENIQKATNDKKYKLPYKKDFVSRFRNNFNNRLHGIDVKDE